MKIYVTRHGQVLPESYYDDVQFPAGDPSISELGRKQAAHLGNHLKNIGFSGIIYASPFIRTLETAEIIADYTASRIIPWAPMREIVRNEESNKIFKGLSIEEIKERFSHIDIEAELSYPWWISPIESMDDVQKRIESGLKKLEFPCRFTAHCPDQFATAESGSKYDQRSRNFFSGLPVRIFVILASHNSGLCALLVISPPRPVEDSPISRTKYHVSPPSLEA